MTDATKDARDDGGQAFPGTHTDGMSLRDYFAGQALTGVIAAVCDGKHAAAKTGEVIATACYELADAMLAERSK